MLLQAETRRGIWPRLVPESEELVVLAIRIVATVLVAFVVLRLAGAVIKRLERFLASYRGADRHAGQRARTLGQIVRSAVTVIVVGGAVIHVLEIFGWDVKPLLAGAGIIGVALGFGAQTLVRDVIAGVFILLEDQYGVGDLVEVQGKPATVESLSVRSTVLRDFNGYVHYVPNGEMRIVTNRSRDWNRVTVDIVVAASQDLDRAIAICRREVEAFNADAAWRERLIDPVELWGLESVTVSEATIRAVVKARPGASSAVASRELRLRFHHALAEARIAASSSAAMPAPAGPAAPPAGSKLAAPPATETGRVTNGS